MNRFAAIRKNLHRLHDWRVERLAPFRGDDLVKFGEFDLIACSKESVEWMLKLDFDNVTKPGSNDMYFYWLRQFIGENGIFTLRHGAAPALKHEHDHWFHQRKTASLIFTKNKFKSLMYETFKEKSEIFVKVCEEAASSSEVMDIQSKYFAFTIDSIQNIFFGRKVDTVMKKEVDPYGEAFDGAHREMMKLIFNGALRFILCRYLLPFPFGDIFEKMQTSLIMLHHARLSEESKVFYRHIKTLDNISAEVIAEARGDKELHNRRDLLALFIASKMGFSDGELRDIILNLTIAGRDTTACTLTWITFMLTQNPDVEKELCKEIDAVLKGKPPTYEQLDPSNMPYLNGVLFEALRLYPPVPLDGKVTSQDTTYLDGMWVPKGATIIFLPYVLGRDPKLYPDPLKVDPTRWIPFKTPDPFQFPVFQAGPRFCLGRDMAQFEAKFLIASVYQRFTFKLKEGEAEKITYSNSLTMNLCNSKKQDSHELLVIPQKRS